MVEQTKEMKDGQSCGEAPLLWFVISIIVYLVIYLFVLAILLHNIKNSTIHNFNVHGRKEEEKLTLPATYSKQMKWSVNFNNHEFHNWRQHTYNLHAAKKCKLTMSLRQFS